jgi:hypothetical protein
MFAEIKQIFSKISIWHIADAGNFGTLSRQATRRYEWHFIMVAAGGSSVVRRL